MKFFDRIQARRQRSFEMGDYPARTLTAYDYRRGEGKPFGDLACLGWWTHSAGPTIAVYEDGWVMAQSDPTATEFGSTVWADLCDARPDEVNLCVPAPPGAKCTAELEGH